MQPSGGGGGGGGGRSAQHPGVTQKTGTTKSDDAGHATVIEYIQGFTPMPNPIARRILGETSLDPEKTDMYASLIGLRDGGMPGFRPLGYADGDFVERGDLGAISTAEEDPYGQVYKDLYAFLTGGNFTEQDLREYIRRNKQALDAMAENNPARANMYEGAKIKSGFDEWMKGLREKADEEWLNDASSLGGSFMTPVAPTLAGASRLSAATEPTDAPIPTEEVVGMTSFRPKGSTLDEMGSMFDLYRDGGYVKQKYAYGGSVPHGTVAGELPRYGDMSVREEGESMRELAKRHKDQRWYNRMGGGLGSLMRRA